MRELFITELVKDVLGPRNGIYEVLYTSPLTEYITGVLSPQIMGDLEVSRRIIIEEEFSGLDIPETEEDEFLERDIQAPPLIPPALNPKNRPSSFGISFIVESDNVPKIDVCLTWSRYKMENKRNDSDDNNNIFWKRVPKFAIISSLDLNNTYKLYYDTNGKASEPQKAEISFHSVVRKLDDKRRLVNLYFVNMITIPQGKNPTAEEHIFQPQIRVVCKKGTRIIPAQLKLPSNEEEKELSILYKEKPVMARGFLCSAVWLDIDPQNQCKEQLDFPQCVNEPPFAWVDGAIVPENQRKMFEVSDVRSEFVPLYSISFPDMDWPSKYGRKPELKASRLANTYNPKLLQNDLKPFVDAYNKWISELQNKAKNFSAHEKLVAQKLIQKCQKVAKRIQKGIKILVEDSEVRLAFCFANKALDLQSQWKRGRGLVWRPFQLGYILMVLESLANPDSKDRDVCDLLWVPTGAGKTEAYLFLVLFTIAFRRRKSLAQRKNSGVVVITRYTLRLLTIQQFRRLLAAITAAEYLRVENLTQSNHVGWYPNGYSPRDNYIWGSEAFSAGLWVGGGVTPNRLLDTWGGSRKIRGAISILKGKKGDGEPAQVTNCPACETILAIPSSGIMGNAIIYLVVNCNVSVNQLVKSATSINGKTFLNTTINSINVFRHTSNNFFTLKIDISKKGSLKAKDVDVLWMKHIKPKLPHGTELVPARASRPGYFIRYYVSTKGEKKEYDYEIFCPNPKCPLHRPWTAGYPLGWIHGDKPHPNSPTGIIEVPNMPHDNKYVYVQEAFRKSNPYISDRIPIHAYTIDEQIYHRLPSIVVATVDKFARPAFEPRAAALFGNIDHYHCIWGYYRKGLPPLSSHNNKNNHHPSPAGRGNQRNYVSIKQPDPPELILQDELHLIEGPLGSLVGFYETAIDYLCSINDKRAKYIASTATVRNAEEQVNAIFTRTLTVFPPPGLTIEDQFFVRGKKRHPLDDIPPGRLYLGICAPGRGPLTPLVRIYARLIQTAENLKSSHSGVVDPFWTITGYFNAIRELGGARALYRQDIKERLRQISHNPRNIQDDRVVELSSRTDSTALPAILNKLSSSYPSSDVPDALFTTAMFGTGIDIPRLSLMVVNGQPKTTSAYIQATGRVGRKRGALVVTFLRATRPRDLSHYEMFCGYHEQIHRFVEPATVFPFAEGVLDRACGPVCVFILRNSRNFLHPWHSNASLMAFCRNTYDVIDIPHLMDNRAQNQPSMRRPKKGCVFNYVSSELDRWQNVASREGNKLKYVEYAINLPPKFSVVLGDSQHSHARLVVVYKNAPQSLRDIEETCGFET